MKNLKLGDKDIPAIALGTWSWGKGINGGNAVFGNTYGEKELIPVFKKGVEMGLTLWDTAAVYGMGASETILGQCLKELEDPGKIALSTKFTPLMLQTKNAMRRSLSKSKERLGRSTVDLYWIHSPGNINKWTKEAARLVKEGLVKAVGVSNHDLEQVKYASHILEEEGIKLAAVQNHYSLIYPEHEQSGLIEWCNKNNVLFFSYMVLEQGALTGAYSPSNPLPSTSRRGKVYNKVLLAISPIINVMSELREGETLSPAEVAIAWAIAKGTIPLIGVTKEKHIHSAVSAMNLNLHEDEVKRIDQTAQATGVRIKASWE